MFHSAVANMTRIQTPRVLGAADLSLTPLTQTTG